MNLKLLLILLVISNAQESCYSDSDCVELNSCVQNKCHHKSLFPLATTEYIGIVVMILVSTIANAGGVGGSSMTISLMLLLHGFNAHSSVALTQVFIFAGTCTATVLKIRDRHPTRDRPLIYYDVLMQIASPILLGVSIGVMVNPAFPNWLILGLLTLVVIALVWDVLKRSFFYYKKENSQRKVVPDANEDRPELNEKESSTVVKRTILRNDSGKIDDQEEIKENGEEEEKSLGGSANKSLAEGSQDIPDNNSITIEQSNPVLFRRLTTIYQDEKKIIAWIPLTYFVLLAAASILFPLIKGSSSSKSISGIKLCSPAYIGINVAYFVFMVLMSFGATVYLVRKTDVLEKTNYVFDEGDIHWTYKKCAIVTLASIPAGIVVGLLGMGGGNIIGPMLMMLGVRPEVSTISSSFTIFISSGTAAAQYFILGALDLNYSAWFFGLSLIGSILGIQVVRKIAIKKQRVSFLIFCLFFILFASLVIIPTIGIMTAIQQSSQGTFQLGFANKIC